MDYGDFVHKKWSNCLVEINGKVRTDIKKVEVGTHKPTLQETLIISFNNGGRLNLYLQTQYSTRPSYCVWTLCSDLQGINISGCPAWRRRCSKCTIVAWNWDPKKDIHVDLSFCCYGKTRIPMPSPFVARIHIYNPSPVQPLKQSP